jgi:phosphoenolpyruvate carboxylase
MARPNQELNSSVNREAAERLQAKLYQAAEAALDIALTEGKIPGNLLSSCQSILRDANLMPDLTTEPTEAERLEVASEQQWISDLTRDVGL